MSKGSVTFGLLCGGTVGRPAWRRRLMVTWHAADAGGRRMHGTYTFSVDAPTPKRCDACDGGLSHDERLASAFSVPAESGGVARRGRCSMHAGPMIASYPRSPLNAHPHRRPIPSSKGVAPACRPFSARSTALPRRSAQSANPPITISSPCPPSSSFNARGYIAE